MTPIQFEIKRAQASRAAQMVTGADVIGDRPVEAWETDLAQIDVKAGAENKVRMTLQGSAALWDSKLRKVFDITRHVAVLAKKRFKDEPEKLAFANDLVPSDNSRAVIYEGGVTAREAWEKADPDWKPLKDATLPALKALLQECFELQKDHPVKLAEWRTAAGDLTKASDALHEVNVAWYAAALREYPEGTPHGEMIRSTVPVTTDAAETVGQSVITNLTVTGATVRFEVEAPHASTFTCLHKAPGQPVFAVVQANTTVKVVTLNGLAVGERAFKAFGANSQGIGPESAEATVLVAQAKAA